MKKILSLVLILILAVVALSSCLPVGPGGQTTPTEPEVTYDLDNAKGALADQYRATLIDTNQTLASYHLTKQLLLRDGNYTVTWTVDNDAITITDYVPADDKDILSGKTHVTVNVPARGSEDINYTLTATIAAPNGETATLKFKLVVPQFAVHSFEEYMAAEKGETVTVMGVVHVAQSKAAGFKYNAIYLADTEGKGGYYIYSFAGGEDAVETHSIKVGMTVLVSGVKDIYNGTHEVKDATIDEVVDSEVKDLVVPNLTEAYTNAADLKDASITNFLGCIVTIDGVTIGGNDNDVQFYYYFTLNGKQSYIRLADSCGLPKEELDAIKELHKSNMGATATVRGLVNVYNGAFYLTPVDATPITNIKASSCEHTGGVPTCTEPGNCEKCGFPYLNAIGHKLESGVNCANCGKDLTLTIPQVLKAEDGTLMVVSGTVSEIVTEWSDQYGNISVNITDASGNVLYLYRLATNVKVGDYITVTGKVGSYNGDKQIAAGATAVIGTAPELPPVVDTPVMVTKPEVGVAYDWVVEQGNLNKTLYFGGETANYPRFFTSTEDASASVKVYLEAVEGVEGGYRLYFMKGDVKTYVQIFVDGTYVNAGLTTSVPEGHFTWNSEHNTLVAAVNGDTHYIGMYGTYDTFGASKISYISTSFAAHLFTTGKADAPAVDKEAEKILNDLYALADGESLTGDFTLTGKITALDSYKNPTIVVEGFEDKPVYCYKLVVDNAVGDVITVTATSMKNYKGTYEFMNCTLVTSGNEGGEVTPPVGGGDNDGGEVLTSLPGNLAFAGAANKADADSYMKTNFPEWKITGKLGQTYGGYLGFGRSGDKTSAITSPAFSVSEAFTLKVILKGNGSNGVMTSTITITLNDAEGNVVATGYANGSDTAAITPVDAKDTTYTVSFTFVEGKTWTDVSTLVVSFAKTTGNIGLKSLDFVK